MVDYHANETGFTQTSIGDSGNPLWMIVEGPMHYGVNAVIAVHNGGFETGNVAGFYIQNKTFQCRQWATKVTSDISQWIMEWHNRVA